MNSKTLTLAVVLSSLTVGGCGGGSGGSLNDFSEEALQEAKVTYSTLVLRSYRDTLESAELMQDAIELLVDDPSAFNMNEARDAWKAVREIYGQTEAYRFYEGPIDDAETGPEGRINAWPLDEAFIDYVEGDDDAGIINDVANYPDITKEVLIESNEAGGTDETAISTGFHAIEFLLWGQDRNTDGPGRRSFRDYLTTIQATAENPERRGQFLKVVTEILIDDLNSLVDAWAPEQDNYRAEFEALSIEEALRRMLTGMGVLSNGELAGERMDVALDTLDQEDEHSCFSDNTHRDIVADAKGIQNVYLGSYSSVTGLSIDFLMEEIDPELNEQIKSNLQTTVSLAEDIPVPFDQAISDEDGRQKIQATIDSLRDQADLVVEVGQALGIENLTTDLP